MKATGKREFGFTLVEMLVVIAIVAILAALILPSLSQSQAKAKRIQCASNLRQVGLGFHSFLHDHSERLPMQVSTNAGGTLEFARASFLAGDQFYFQYRHFQALSNDLTSPKVLVCPTDLTRTPAADFVNFDNRHLSYFIGVNADNARPNSILAGDRNITNAAVGAKTLLKLDIRTVINWTREMHVFKGNILFADGHVERLNGMSLEMPKQNAPAQMHLIVPTLKPPPSPPSALANGAANPSTGPWDSIGGPGQSIGAGGLKKPGGGPDWPAKGATALREGAASSRLSKDESMERVLADARVSVEPASLETNAEVAVVDNLKSRNGAKKAATNWWLLILLLLLILMELVRRRMRRKGNEEAMTAYEVPLS